MPSRRIACRYWTDPSRGRIRWTIGSGKFFRHTQRFVVYFDGSVNGLDKGAPVKFRGVPIGTVTDVRLKLPPQPADDQRIPVLVEIDEDHGREPRRELAVGLGPITFPPCLDRSELVSRVGTNELRPSPFDFWAGSLNEQFKSALGQNLALMIGPCRVTTYPWYAGTFDATVGIDVLRFEVNTDGSAHLVARWAIRDGRGTTVGDVRESNLSAPVVGRDARDAVAALSEVLTEFSRELATAIRAATEQLRMSGPLSASVRRRLSTRSERYWIRTGAWSNLGWMPEHVPRVVIVGGGFGGLAAAKALGSAPVRTLLVDRNNHHLFQPLLYQVATSVLTPAQIGSPIRGILRKQRNTTVILGEVTGVDKDRRCIFVNSADRQGVSVPYDVLVLATGVRHSYFGHDEFARFAPGLKSLADAVAIRNRILRAFEQAEAEEDPSRHRDLLTFVLVGAGPTGVELAAAIGALVRSTLRSEFRRIDPASARIVLVDMGERVLGSFAERLSTKAKARLERLGVEVRLGQGVDRIDADGVIVAGERISSKTVIWTAGVTPSPAGKWLAVETDRAGRVRVQKDLTVPGHPEIFVVGDTASLEQDGRPLPGVAQVAIQQGRYAGRLIRQRLRGGSAPRPFRYFDKGSMAVVGKGFAVLQAGKVRMSGFLAWLVWAGVHLEFLAQSNLRVSVFLQWVWTYVTGQRGSWLIIDHHGAEPANAVTGAGVGATHPTKSAAASVGRTLEVR